MTQTTSIRPASSVTIPAFEMGGSLLALVPKSALGENRSAIDIVVVGKREQSAALRAELTSASNRLTNAQQKNSFTSGSFKVRKKVGASGFDTALDISAEGQGTATAALISRILRALARVADVAGDELVIRALERSSDMGAIVDLLRSTLPLLSAERELDPTLEGSVAALEAEENLIRRAGGLKDAAWVSEYLGISPKSVAAKARRSELLAITRGDRNLYPAFQFRDGQVVAGIREILDPLPLTNGWSRLSFMLTPDPGLDERTPLEAFATDPETVISLARTTGAQGAP